MVLSPADDPHAMEPLQLIVTILAAAVDAVAVVEEVLVHGHDS